MMIMIIADIIHHRHHRRWCTFFKPAYFFAQRMRKWTAFCKVNSEFINKNPHFFYVMKIPNSLYQIPDVKKYTIPMPKTSSMPNKTPSTSIKTPSALTETSGMPTKTPCTPNLNLCCFVARLFLLRIGTFWRTFCRLKKMQWCTKNDKYQVWVTG